MLELSIYGVHSMDFWVRLEKTFEGFGGVSWNGNFEIFLVAIQIYGQSTLVIPFKVHEYFVTFLKIVQEMISVGIGYFFDTKNFNAKDFSPRCILPEARIVFARYITMRSKIFY